ncbi:MAG: acyl-CoA dehydrogenase, partial [Alphaproteobacteria bacterium]|nr:acyl-CoA dehydrogenase [Alphaproteobacteria bacterium]
LAGAEARDKTHEFPREILTKMGELGLLGMLVPEEWGGAGADYQSLVLAIEEIAAADGAISTVMSVQNSLANMCILKFGNDAQKEKFLRPLAAGTHIGAFALTEPHAGSDAGALRTTAKRDGEAYILNGHKQFITSGKEGDVVIVFAVTDAAAGKRGISAFIVPTDTAGYTVTRIEEKMGQHCSDTAAISFVDMRIPAENRLGEEGEGYKIALSNLEGGRIGIAAQCLGMARAALESALAYAQERQSFGKPILEHQAVGFRLAQMATELEASRQLVHHAARLRDEGKPCLKEACMAKLFASEAGERIVREAMQVLGGYGYVSDFPLERIYRDIRVASMYEGTSDIQKLIITREISK